MTHTISRRSFLGLSAAAAGAAVAPWAVASTTAAAAAAPRWPGHQPGKVYLGQSTATDFSAALAKTGPVGLQRTFGQWTSEAAQMRTILADHAAGRLPWISFKGPIAGAAGWRDIARGKHDAALAARARSYAALAKPLIVTFHHEPSDGGTEAEGVDYAAAWCRIYDRFSAEGALTRVCFAPILSDWLFQPRNGAQAPENWVTDAMLSRINTNAFLGMDLYQNRTTEGFAERIGAALAWTQSRGFPTIMVGIGETASCLALSPSPERFIQNNWAWCQANASRIGAVSYFNSTANSRSGLNWLLDEPGTTKLTTYRAILASSTACTLRTL